MKRCDFSGLPVPECQESICDCWTEGVEDGTGGMGENPAERFVVVSEEEQRIIAAAREGDFRGLVPDSEVRRILNPEDVIDPEDRV